MVGMYRETCSLEIGAQRHYTPYNSETFLLRRGVVSLCSVQESGPEPDRLPLSIFIRLGERRSDLVVAGVSVYRIWQPSPGQRQIWWGYHRFFQRIIGLDLGLPEGFQLYWLPLLEKLIQSCRLVGIVWYKSSIDVVQTQKPAELSLGGWYRDFA